VSALDVVLGEDSDYSIHTHACAQLRALPPYTCECGSKDRVSSARAELAALRERVAKLEAALVKADEMAKAADTATVWRDKESLDALDLALAAFAEANPALDNDAREATK
jgi:hypothetical protein